jgi:hypothetical protein
MQQVFDRPGRPPGNAEGQIRQHELMAVVADLVRELRLQRMRFTEVAPSSRIGLAIQGAV